MSASSAAVPVAGGPTRRVAVVDVGSNSVRLVVYDRIERTPLPLFNERLMCGLGRGLSESGRLDPEAMERALGALMRYAALIRAMRVERIDAVATAAVREAVDGAAFVQRIEEASGLRVRVLSGAEEARYSALGVLAAAPEASGLMADLGGGSLELVRLVGHEVGEAATLPLGPVRLNLPTGTAANRAADTIAAALASVPWLDQAAGGDLYIVGGAWRAIGHMEVQRNNYPLHVLHGFTVDADRMRDVASAIAGMSRASLEQAQGISRERIAVLPLAAQILRQLIDAARPGRVIISAYGLREGLLYDYLPKETRRQDPLIAACGAVAATSGRFPEQSEPLMQWMEPLFPEESAAERRLRHAAVLLSDSGWRTHPDYRAEQAFLDVARGPIVGLDHNERARLALMVYARYSKQRPQGQTARILELMSAAEAERAFQVGLALRLALTISGGVATLLQGVAVSREGNRLVLRAVPDAAHLLGHVVQRRLEALARSMSLNAEIVL